MVYRGGGNDVSGSGKPWGKSRLSWHGGEGGEAGRPGVGKRVIGDETNLRDSPIAERCQYTKRQ